MARQHRSNEELAEIARQHGDMVYRIIRVRIARQADADDVFQEVFLKLVESADKLQSDEHIKFWLIRVTLNCCNLYFRKRKRDDAASYVEQVGNDNQSLEEFSDIDFQKSAVEEAILAGEREQAVYAAVRVLPAKYKVVIHLFYYEQRSIHDIAQIVGIMEGAVKTRLFRARTMLAEILKEGGWDGADQ